MKITDDYQAKYRLWAANPRVVSVPRAPRLPNFKSRRFASHQEMNQWKEAVLNDLAREAAAKWTT
jgi:hypothetical protein